MSELEARIKRSLKANRWAGYQGKAIDDLSEDELGWLVNSLIEDHTRYPRLVEAMKNALEEAGY